MNILVSLDENYIKPLRVMLYSLFQVEEADMDIYIMHSSISDEAINELSEFVDKQSGARANLINIRVADDFGQALTTFYYTREMYFRLIAYNYLPADLDRILYLDPDILVLNNLDELYKADFENKLFMAAIHSIPTVQPANKARLKITSEKKGIEHYYNSGILMINLAMAREVSYAHRVFDYVEHSKKAGLLMPDQDLLNVVFRQEIKEIPELKYNYDARRYQTYLMMYDYDLKDVMANTSIIHFCGKRKPWNETYVGKFNSLYQYMWQRVN